MAWWAVYSEPKREMRVRDELKRLGAIVFLPYEAVTRRVAVRRGSNVHRVRTADEPVFPRYLFVREGGVGLGTVLAARQHGVLGVVRAGEAVLSVPDVVMEPFLAVANDDGLVKSKDLSRLSVRLGWSVGQRFAFKLMDSRDEPCPFGGLVGRFTSLAELDTTGRVKAWVEMFGAQREITLSYKDVGAIIGSPERVAVSVAA